MKLLNHPIFAQTSHLLALLQGFIEAVTQGQIGLGLGTLDEALDLPGTGASLILLLLLPILRLLLLLVLLRWLLVLLLCWLGTAAPSLQDKRRDRGTSLCKCHSWFRFAAEGQQQ